MIANRVKRMFLMASMTAFALGAQTTAFADAAMPRGLLGELLARLRLASPRAAAAPVAVPVTAGIRGAEATESDLKPYWKGDREQDPAYRAERHELQAAQELADAQKFAEAARAFEKFLTAHPKSPLVPNARFGGALSYAALGDRARARAGFESFLKENPQHPLAHDAEQALAALK